MPEPRSISELPSTSSSTPPPARAMNTGNVVPTPAETAALRAAKSFAGARTRQLGDDPPLLGQLSGDRRALSGEGHGATPSRGIFVVDTVQSVPIDRRATGRDGAYVWRGNVHSVTSGPGSYRQRPLGPFRPLCAQSTPGCGRIRAVWSVVRANGPRAVRRRDSAGRLRDAAASNGWRHRRSPGAARPAVPDDRRPRPAPSPGCPDRGSAGTGPGAG